MKKRLICLLLAMVMLMSVALTGCAQDDDTSADVDENTGAKTITMRIVTEKKVCNTDEELLEYLEETCGGNKKDERYIEMKRVKEAYDAVEEAFSKETKSMYKTNVDIIFYTEEEYFDMLEVTMAEYALEQLEAGMAQRSLQFYIDEYMAAYPEQYSEAAITKSFYEHFPEFKKFQDASLDSEGSNEEMYEVGELGIQQLVYPEAEENQLDIVYIQGEDMYKKYIENGWIVALDEYLSSTGSKLNDYISTTLMSGVKVDGQTFAIPNNVKMGEYTYMLIDKELADAFKYTYESFSDITDCEYFLEDIKNSKPETLPIAASFKECMDFFVWYWNIDVEEGEFGSEYKINTSNEPSVLGCVYGDPANNGRGKIALGFNNLFADEEYRDILLTLKSYEYDGMFKTKNDARTGAAISFMTGTYAIKKAAFYDAEGKEKKESDTSYGVYTDENGKSYYVYVAKYPQAESASLYGNMFAVSANSKNVEACMKVLTALNTNSKMKNLLQYGIEGTNYVINEDTGMLERLNRDYIMNTERTGNCYISYPEEGLPADYWDDAKKQSNETLINPLLGFDFNTRLAEYGSQLDIDQLKAWWKCNEDTWAGLSQDNCKTYDAFELALDTTVVSLDKERVTVDGFDYFLRMEKLTNSAYDTNTGNAGEMDMSGESPYTIYYKWLTEMKYLPDVAK